MRVLTKFLLILIALCLSTNCFARWEIPFCPAGGPPGWMNYFDDKRDQNIWRHYLNYPPANSYQNYYRPVYNRPVPYTINPHALHPVPIRH